MKEIEKNVKIPFPDRWVTRDNNRLRTTIYRKPTLTDRLLDQSSYNPKGYNYMDFDETSATTRVCNAPDSLQDRTDYLNNVFSNNNYNADSERRNTHSNANSKTKTNFNSGLVTIVTISSFRGTSETIARILYLTTDNHF